MQNIYQMQLEIYEAKDCKAHQAGQIYRYPQDSGRLCPWLLDSAQSMLRTLMFGGCLPWTYAGTPYEKVIDPDGLTTEFVRCPDPTTAVVLKISRQKIGFVGEDGLPVWEKQP
jgi:uncharacterized repeat protein (TIGR04076 family)